MLKYVQPPRSQSQLESNPTNFPSKSGYGVKGTLFVGRGGRQKWERERHKREMENNFPRETEKCPEGVVNGLLWGEKPVLTFSCSEVTEQRVEFGL